MFLLSKFIYLHITLCSVDTSSDKSISLGKGHTFVEAKEFKKHYYEQMLSQYNNLDFQLTPRLKFFLYQNGFKLNSEKKQCSAYIRKRKTSITA